MSAGTDIGINLMPTDKRAILRHLMRIQRLRYAMTVPRQKNRIKEFQDEIEIRSAKLAAIQIKVPEGETSLQDLINRVSDGK
jgi:hypothetical protein